MDTVHDALACDSWLEGGAGKWNGDDVDIFSFPLSTWLLPEHTLGTCAARDWGNDVWAGPDGLTHEGRYHQPIWVPREFGKDSADLRLRRSAGIGGPMPPVVRDWFSPVPRGCVLLIDLEVEPTGHRPWGLSQRVRARPDWRDPVRGRRF